MKRILSLLFLLLPFTAVHAQSTLEPGKTLERTIKSGELQTYTLELGARQFVYGEADQIDLDLVLTLYGPDGSVVSRFDEPARGPEPFRFTTKVAGTYRMEIKPFKDENGRYTLTLIQSEPEATTPEKRVDQLMAPHAGTTRPGAVVAVTQGGKLVYAKGYGMADLEFDVPNTPTTIFHMASVSKQFTAFAVILLAQQGKLSLDDDVRKYIPELHDFGKTITLRHLIHHNSGLRDQWNLWVMAGGRLDDVIQQQDLLRLMERQRELNFDPGTQHLYSNSGYMLLSEVVSRVTGEPFGEWMRHTVFEPLGMKHTQVYDDHERIVRGRAYSYYPGPGGYKKSVLSYGNSGATSLFTTAEDLACWLRNFHTAEVGGPAAQTQMVERSILANGDTLGYASGLGIGTYRGLRVYQHGGADAGYRTMLSYYPDLDAGVILLSNLASIDLGRIANEVADAFLGDRMTKEETAQPVLSPAEEATVAPAILETYTGTFALQGGPTVRFEREGNRLVARTDNQHSFTLIPESDTLFRVTIEGHEARVSFHRNMDGTVSGGSFYQGGVVPLTRVQPYVASPEELAGYTGTFYSPELETIYTLRIKDDRLVATHRRNGDITFSVKEKDHFSSDAWFFGDVTFERDASGAVTAFRATNDRVRNLKFVRVVL